MVEYYELQDLNNQLLAATNSLEIIELSDKILNERLRRYMKHTFLKGESLLSLGKFDEALSIFEQILEYNDDRFTGRAHNSIGFCYSMKNKPRKAESEFKKAQKYCDESSLLLNSATLNMATYYSMTKQNDDAYKIFKELYGMDSSNRFEDSYMLVLMSSNNPQEVIDTYDLNIDESFPKDEQVMARKAIALMDLERFEEAVPILDDALKYTDDKEGLKIIHFHLGVSYYRLGELDKSISEYEKAREYSDDPGILHQLANIYGMTNQQEKALEIFKELSDIDPYNDDIKKRIENLELEINKKDLLHDNNFNSIQEAIMQATVYSSWKEYEKAIEVYDLIIGILPEQSLAWKEKGCAYYHLGKYEEALKCLDKAMKYDPDNIDLLYYNSLVYIKLEDYESAHDMIAIALRNIPDNKKYIDKYCYILEKLGRTKEAQDIANKSSINPKSLKTYKHTGVVLEQSTDGIIDLNFF